MTRIYECKKCKRISETEECSYCHSYLTKEWTPSVHMQPSEKQQYKSTNQYIHVKLPIDCIKWLEDNCKAKARFAQAVLIDVIHNEQAKEIQYRAQIHHLGDEEEK